MHIINCPSVPYWGHIPDGVHPGTTIQIEGHIPHHCSKFEINLYAGHETGHHAEKHSNVALQMRPKIHGKKVICNSRQFGQWGHKEKHRQCHLFHHGSNFNITIIVEHQYYLILCNGQNVSNFAHRLPFHEVRVLNIEGHVNLHRIEYKHGQYQGVVQTTPYPSAPYPSAPYPSAPAYPVSYPSVPTYPAPQMPTYIPTHVVQPVYQTPYVAPTVVIEDSHHHHGHHHHGGIIDTLFGNHHHHHGHHGHHGHHHHHHW